MPPLSQFTWSIVSVQNELPVLWQIFSDKYMKYSKPPLSQFISDKYMKCSKFPEWVASLVTVFMMYSKCPDWVASLVTVYMNSLTKDNALYMIYWIQWEILFGSSLNELNIGYLLFTVGSFDALIPWHHFFGCGLWERRHCYQTGQSWGRFI